MDVLVTGAAGFVGSNLVEALLDAGHRVRGVDCFTGYYDPAVKWANVAAAREDPAYELVEADLREADPGPLIDGMEVVYHLAAQPGVRLSWAAGFPRYVEQNVLVTQRLLEAAHHAGTSRVVYASSSSVYGNSPRYPTAEDDLPQPHSPYGVTKLAAEHLCGLYAANHGVHTVSLRYFTVYGPRQRPDMAIHRFLRAGLDGEPVPLYGSGEQRRDFTYVGDVVAATIAAATADVEPGTVLNVAGGGSTTINELVGLVGELAGSELAVNRLPVQAGDVDATGGTIDRARELLNWKPVTDLRVGLAVQLDWHRAAPAVPVA